MPRSNVIDGYFDPGPEPDWIQDIPDPTEDGWKLASPEDLSPPEPAPVVKEVVAPQSPQTEAPDDSSDDAKARHDGFAAGVDEAERLAWEAPPFALFTGSPNEVGMRAILDVAANNAWPAQPVSGNFQGLWSEAKRALVIHTDGAFWRYQSESGRWLEVPRLKLEQAVQLYDAWEWGAVGKTGKRKTLTLSAGMIASSVECARTLVSREKFFSSSPIPGVVLKSGYWTVDAAGALQRVDHSPWHAVRHGWDFDWPAEPGWVLSELDALSDEWDPVCGSWMAFLRQVLDGREQEARAIQEFAGATLTGQATQWQRAILMVGEGGNGKSTLSKGLLQLFPQGTIVSTNPGAWREDYHRSALVGALVNVVTEVDAFRNPSALKAVITGDPIEARYTGSRSGAPFVYVPVAGHMFSANQLPDVVIDAALAGRLIVIEFTRTFRGKVTERREEEIMRGFRREMPGMLAWAMGGLSRLRRDRAFSYPDRSRKIIDSWMGDASPVGRWIEERCDVDPDPSTSKRSTMGDTLYQSFRSWCIETEGMLSKNVPTREKFGREMSRLKFPSEVQGKHRVRVHRGVALISVDTGDRGR